MLYFSTDNAVDVYLNNSTSTVATTNEVYTAAPASPSANYSNVFTSSFSLVVGANALNFVVRNWGSEGASNPTGLVYKAVVNYCVSPNPEPTTVTVSINKFIDGVQATAASSSNAAFPMASSWVDEGGIGTGSGTYELNAGNNYQAMTSSMNSGADYMTNEVLGGAIVASSCEDEQPFSLVGYTSGNSLAAAAAGTPTTTPPSFTDLSANKYVIVWNHNCATLPNPDGTIGGEVTGGVDGQGELAVTGVTPIQTTAIANDTYANGWSYNFHLTIPTNEQNLSMKFANWFNSVASTTILVANNMQISSGQADNGGAFIPLTAANTYSTPALHMTADLDPVMPGLQVNVLVQVKIPVGSVNGPYTTTYGVQTLP
jgi:hypothetical protein